MPHRPIHQVISEHECVSVPDYLSVRDATRMMREAHQSAALVTEHGVLTGIFTERDATFRVMAEGLDPDCTQVGQVMTQKPQTITEDKPFGHALHLMYEGQFRHVPVVTSDGRPLGVVSARDALALDAVEFATELVRREEITVIL